MQEDTEAAQAEGEALPEVTPTPAKAGFFSPADKAGAAVEAWYAAHFHAAVVSGRTPITADEKAALVTSVADAVAPTKE
ncbi:MAG: hypothetical protein ACREPQ_09625 [Rhodanobacter sp.]